MNERLRELVKQTGKSFGGGHPEYWTQGIDEHLEKFAELIVRDCAGVCDMYAMPDGTSQTAMILSMAIKHKFGITDGN